MNASRLPVAPSIATDDFESSETLPRINASGSRANEKVDSFGE